MPENLSALAAKLAQRRAAAAPVPRQAVDSQPLTEAPSEPAAPVRRSALAEHLGAYGPVAPPERRLGASRLAEHLGAFGHDMPAVAAPMSVSSMQGLAGAFRTSSNLPGEDGTLADLITNPDFFIIGAGVTPISWARSSPLMDPLDGALLANNVPSAFMVSLAGVEFTAYLQQAARTQLVRNPSGAGGVVSSSLLPGNWAFSFDQPIMAVVGYGPHPTIPGAFYVDVRWHNLSGVAANFSSVQFQDGVRPIPVTPGQVLTSSVYAQLIAGSFPAGVNLAIGSDFLSSTFGYITSEVGFPTISATSLKRISSSVTAPALSAYATSTITTGFGTPVPPGADFTVRFTLPQCEVGSHPSSPILANYAVPGSAPIIDPGQLIPNYRATGGSSSTFPSTWFPVSQQNIMSVVGYGAHPTVAGAFYVDVQYHNTSGSQSDYNGLYFAAEATIAIVPGDFVTTSVYMELISGVIPDSAIIQGGFDGENSGSAYNETYSLTIPRPVAGTLTRVFASALSNTPGTDAFAVPGIYFTDVPAGANFTVRYTLPQFSMNTLYATRAADIGTIDFTGLTAGGLPQLGELFAVVVPMDWNTAPAGSAESAPFPNCFHSTGLTAYQLSLFWDTAGGHEDYRHDDSSGNQTISVASTAAARTPYARGGAWDAGDIYQYRGVTEVASMATDGTYPLVTSGILGEAAYSYIVLCGLQGAPFTPVQRSALVDALLGAVATAVASVPNML